MTDFNLWINFVYVISAALFIFGLKLLGHPATARKGNLLSANAMFLAIVVTLLDQNILSYEWIAGAMVAGRNCWLLRRPISGHDFDA